MYTYTIGTTLYTYTAIKNMSLENIQKLCIEKCSINEASTICRVHSIEAEQWWYTVLRVWA